MKKEDVKFIIKLSLWITICIVIWILSTIEEVWWFGFFAIFIWILKWWLFAFIWMMIWAMAQPWFDWRHNYWNNK